MWSFLFFLNLFFQIGTFLLLEELFFCRFFCVISVFSSNVFLNYYEGLNYRPLQTGRYAYSFHHLEKQHIDLHFYAFNRFVYFNL